MGSENHEPIFAQFHASLEYVACKPRLEEKGWMNFLQKFKGNNDKVAMEFSQIFDRNTTKVDNLEIKVSKELMSKVTRLPLIGEKYFKGGQLDLGECLKFLKLAYKSINWSKGVLKSYIA